MQNKNVKAVRFDAAKPYESLATICNPVSIEPKSNGWFYIVMPDKKDNFAVKDGDFVLKRKGFRLSTIDEKIYRRVYESDNF